MGSGMATYKRIVGVVAVAALLLVAQGCGRKKHGSPQEAFDAAKNAAAKEDYRTFTDCLTPDSQKVMSGVLVLTISMGQGFAALGGEELKAKLKPLDDVLKKHGVKQEEVGKILKDAKKDGPGVRGAMLKIAEPIKDHAAFLEDLAAAGKKAGGDDKNQATAPFKNAELKDLTVSGDTAKGAMVTSVGGKEKRQPMYFRQVDGGWKIDLVEAVMQKGGL
jgi:hypothetical protein